MRLIVTIDTEEDNWVGFETSSYTARNAERLPALQALFDEHGVRPTYLVTYVMVRDADAAAFLCAVHADGRCEIGAHCHPWNTPPVREQKTAHNSMMCNLPAQLQYDKLDTLTDEISARCGVTPLSFRAGRWGFSPEVGAGLERLGYRVDTSITPYLDWTSDSGVDYSSIPLEPYWTDLRQVYPDASTRKLLEIPATVGFLQSNFGLASRWTRRLLRPPLRSLRIYGILNRLGLLNRVWLCPEMHSASDMIRLTEVLRSKGFPFVNLMFHSPTLQAGLTPFVRSVEDERTFLKRIRTYLEYASAAGLTSATLTEAAGTVQHACGTRPAPD